MLVTRMARPILLGAVAAGMAAWAATAGDKSSLPPVEVQMIEGTPGLHSLPQLAMRDIGPEYNLTITDYSEFQGGGQAGAVFAGGHGDVLTSGIDKLFALRKEGLVEVKAIAAVGTKINWTIMTSGETGIKTVEDMRGKAIGISGPGSVSDTMMRYVLNKHGIDPDKDVQLIAIGGVQSLKAAVENRKVEAGAMVNSPDLKPELESGALRVVSDTAMMPFGGNVFMVRAADLEKDREKFVRVVSVLKIAMDKLKNDRAYARALAKSRLPKVDEATLDAMIDYYANGFWSPMDGELDRKLYESSAEILLGAKRAAPEDIPPFEEAVVNIENALM